MNSRLPSDERTRLPLGRRPILTGLALILSLWMAAGKLQAARPGPQVLLSAPRVETGAVLGVRVNLQVPGLAATAVGIAHGAQRATLFPDPSGDRGVYAGFVAVPLDARPGRTELTVEWTEGGASRSEKVRFEVVAGRYGEEALRVDPRHVRPSPEELERIRRDQKRLKQVYASGSPERLWRGGFHYPVPGEVNGPFGTRRLFNGELQSRHTGVDFRAQEGDPVRSAGDGVVRLAEDLFYSGNAVIIDHGAGVFTAYAHLSRISVAVGQRVAAGEVVGRIGATGRATGPHLHWGLKVNSVSANPLLFVSLVASFFH
jgi:murein DD-endopeptidase MepM/ murein hydrolase activator NlpD